MDGVRADEAQPIKPTTNTMKTNTLIVIAAAIGLSGAAHAEEGKGPRPPHKLPPEVIAKFDKDGDGKLNDDEKAEAKAARKKEMLEKFDADKNGKLNNDEKAAMREEMKKKILEKFDKDGDGELNKEERAEMRKTMPNHPGGPKRPKGKGDGPRPGKGGGDVEAPGAGE
jgi:Ca2+-binding EF-hand superfamily protein